MHQSNVLHWYENEFEIRVCNSMRKMKNRKKREKRMYYQYHVVDSINRMMGIGEVMSEFQVMGSNNIFVVYREKKQRSGIMN